MSKSKKRSSVKSTSATVKTGRQKSAQPAVVISKDRQQMISEAAYYLAEQRGFSSGDELGDWFQAESQINVSLTQTGD